METHVSTNYSCVFQILANNLHLTVRSWETHGFLQLMKKKNKIKNEQESVSQLNIKRGEYACSHIFVPAINNIQGNTKFKLNYFQDFSKRLCSYYFNALLEENELFWSHHVEIRPIFLTPSHLVGLYVTFIIDCIMFLYSDC